MQFEKVSSEGLQREYLLKFENQEIDEIVDRQLDEMRPTVKIKGFRPGRVPTGQLKKIYGQKLSVDVLNQKVGSFIEGYIKEEGIRLAATPIYNLLSKNEDDQLHVSVKLLLFPEIPEVSLDKFELQRLVLSEGDLKEAIEKNISFFMHSIREFNEVATEETVSDACKVRLELEVSVEGQPYKLLSSEHTVIIGAGNMVPDLEVAVLGMSTGEEKTISLSLKDFGVPQEDKDKTGSFVIKVYEVFEPKPQDESDRFFKRLGFDNMEHAHKVISENTKAFYENRASFVLRQAYLKRMLELYDFEVPEAFLRQEAHQVAADERAEKERLGVELPPVELDSEGNPPEPSEENFKKARHQLIIGFLLLDHAHKNNIVVEEWEVDRHLQYHAAQLGLGGNVREYIQTARRIKTVYNTVKATLFQDKVVDHILTTLNIAEHVVSKQEFMDAVTNS